jgi:peptide chain release factor 2
VRDARELYDIARDENDEATLGSVEYDAEGLERTIEELEFRRMFSNPADPNNCFLDIQAGSGGTEAQDWASMLERMYLRYCERKGFRAEVLEESPGDVAGIKGATIKVSGEYAYGNLRTESGVHRLVRKSPFDANSRRHTSFASVFVYPEVDDTIEVAVNPADLRVDTYRASGAGGQHVNKTDSAVRITHLPTGLVVVSAEKSQHQNRRLAMQVLRSRLYEQERQRAADSRAAQRKGQIGSGDRSQRIRTYNFPQGRVTDHRIGLTLHKLDEVLEGTALDELVDALVTNHQASELAAMEEGADA